MRGERVRYRAVGMLAIACAALVVAAAGWTAVRPVPKARLELRVPSHGLDSKPIASLPNAVAPGTCDDVFSKTARDPLLRRLPTGPEPLGPFQIRIGKNAVGVRDEGDDELVIPSTQTELDTAAAISLHQDGPDWFFVLAGPTLNSPPEEVWQVVHVPATRVPSSMALGGFGCASLALLLASLVLRTTRRWYRANGMCTWLDGTAADGFVRSQEGEIVGATTLPNGPVLYEQPASASTAIYRGGTREHVPIENAVSGTWRSHRTEYAPTLGLAGFLLVLAAGSLGIAGLGSRRAPPAADAWEAVTPPSENVERHVLGFIRNKAWRLHNLSFSKDGSRAGYVVDETYRLIEGTTEGDCNKALHPGQWRSSPILWSDSGKRHAFFATKQQPGTTDSGMLTVFDGTPHDEQAQGFNLAFRPGTEDLVMTKSGMLCVGAQPCAPLAIDLPWLSDFEISKDGTRAIVEAWSDKLTHSFVVDDLAHPKARPVGANASFGGDHELIWVSDDSTTTCSVHRESGARTYGPYEMCHELLLSSNGSLGYIAKTKGAWTFFIDGRPTPTAFTLDEQSRVHVDGSQLGAHDGTWTNPVEIAWHNGRVARYREGIQATENGVLTIGAIRREHTMIAPASVRIEDDGRFLVYGAADRTSQGWLITWNTVALGD